jgi:sugar/nucleoside kinase (ribokinase family)
MSEPAFKTPRLVGVGAVFIDDIVLPTGQTYMGQLGGGVVHALMGAAVWGERPGINALVGEGLPDEALARLEANLDTSGIVQLNMPQARAWQLFEEDGTRRELYRVPDARPFIAGAQPEHLPTYYQEAEAFYLLQGFEGIREWRQVVKGITLWEPLQQIMQHGARGAIKSVLQDCRIGILSPNLVETRAVYGNLSVGELLDAMIDDGAPVVALRMGKAGSAVADGQTGECYHIPAVPVPQVIDQTGAGNTYCGAFLWGIMNGKGVAKAGAIAAVSASFCVEQVGVLDPMKVDPEERERRYGECQTAIVKL